MILTSSHCGGSAEIKIGDNLKVQYQVNMVDE
jgi:hypothetical protein